MDARLITAFNWSSIDVFNNASTHYPSATAIVDHDKGVAFSYADLERRGRALAGFLRDLGATKGSIIAGIHFNCVEAVDILNASWKLGAVYVPINWRLTPEEIAALLKDVNPQVLIFDSRLLSLAKDSLQKAKTSATTISIGCEGKESDYCYEDSLKASSKRAGESKASLEDPLMILYTGGTTGTPKGAIISVRQVLFNIFAEILTWKLHSSLKAPILLPLFHTGGWNLLTLPLLSVGGTIHFKERFDPGWFIEVVEANKGPFVVFAVPTIYYMISKHKDFAEARFDEIEWMLSGGAPASRGVLERFWEKNVKMAQGYGSTEAGPNNLTMPIWELGLESLKEKWNSVGRPFAFNEVKIVKEDGSLAGPNEYGEIVICSPLSFSGYWKKPDETGRTLRDGCVYTGDIGFYDSKGFYYIVDRKKDVIKSGGEQVYPRELEEIALAHPKVEDAAVIGVPDEKWGEVPKLIIRVRRGLKLGKNEILEVYKGRVAKYKVPKYVAIVDEIPRNAAGKILKRVLRERHGLPRDELGNY